MPRRRSRNVVRYPSRAEIDDRVTAVAERVRAREGWDGETERWRPIGVAPIGSGPPVPTLSLDDYSEVPFVHSVVGFRWYQYRARLRCGDGDVYAVACPPIEGYEEYNRDMLGLGAARLLTVPPAGRTGIELARAVREDAAARESIRQRILEAGGLLIHPYMGIEAVWELAEGLAAETRLPVRVLAPPPHVTRLANNKARFSEIVEALLGPDSLAATAIETEPRGLAERLRQRAQHAEAVALKMPSCASGMGNRIFPSDQLRDRPAAELRDLVERFLADKEWDGVEPVLVVEWHDDVLESPSTQCWIPPLGAGEPEVEEVYEQQLLGRERVFEGAMLSGLPKRLRHELMIKSWLVCRVFQRLGYVGRCSFDALVVGPSLAESRVAFVECNGRWGGTSTPMHLMKRVFGDFRRVPYKAQDYVDDRLKGMEFGDLVAIFGKHLYDRRTGRGRVLLYNVGGITAHGKFDLIVTGRRFADVDRFIRGRIPALIDRYLG